MSDSQTITVCDKCGTPIQGKQEWCRRCGWYSRLKRHVELDAWDREDLPQAKPRSHLEVWLALIPAWAWKLAGGVVVIAVASVIARYLLPSFGPYRFEWTVAQLAIGGIALFAGHIACYMFAIMENDRLTVLDIVLKPIAIWEAVIRDMPATFLRVAMGTWGLAAIACSFIVGGLADKDLLDWGGEPARYNLMKAITEQAQQMAGNNDEGLEKAIEKFAGQAGDLKPNDAAEAPKPRMLIDCLIIGYEPNGDHDFRSLILAADVEGRLVSVGILSTGIPASVRDVLNEQLPKLRRTEPFVPTRYRGVWLHPKLVCRVSALEWSPSKKLVEPIFRQLLSDIPIQK